MLIIFTMQEFEEQRIGRNKETSINHTYISSGEYRRKFDNISDNAELNRLLYQLAKSMLIHCSGTLFENMYWIDPNTIKVVAKETDFTTEAQIIYSERTKRVVAQNENLITIHSHPNSFPPSISDVNSNYFNKYLIGIVVCHDGRIYLYQADEEISEDYYKLTVAEYLKQGYSEDESQRLTWEELKTKFNVLVTEVTDNDV